MLPSFALATLKTRGEKGTNVHAHAVGASRWRGRLWRYGPLLAWMSLIFAGSTGALAASNTSLIIRPLLLWLNPDISEETILRAHFAARKAAHFTEYAVLALLAARAFLTSSNARLRKLWHVAALALVVSYACLDEYHQSFVPTRTGSPYDSLIDSAGGAFAVLVVAIWRARRRRSSR